MSGARFDIGVDVGGTFTDLIAIDKSTGAFTVAKVPTTVQDQSIGFMNGITALGVAPESVASIVHGTTTGTNALLERRGARCGLITTMGFRDSLELGRRNRPRLYGLGGVFEPLIQREHRIEVRERMDALGNVLVPLDGDDVRQAISRLLDLGCTALVIHFLHSYRNPEHEERAASIAADMWPNAYISVGSRILSEIREFERGSTTAVNAYIQPVIDRYIGQLSGKLKDCGVAAQLLIMQSNGGIMSAKTASVNSVQTVLSGPAGGALGTARVAAAAGFPNVIGCDMGGTSFDVCLIEKGLPAIGVEKDLEFGVPIRVPMIDIHTIGAGGGSIAYVDASGLLQVGPQSAGSWPGPVCYGRGGTRPTISDAHFLLGHIDPSSIKGIQSPAGLETVKKEMQRQIGDPLGLDAYEAASAILRIADTHMAAAIRLVSVERGKDPRDFALFAFGGAGPLHCVDLARELGVPKVLVPRYPGILSALGCAISDVRHDFFSQVDRLIDDVSGGEVYGVLAEHVERGMARIADEAVGVETVDVEHEVDMRYHGQSHVFRVPVRGGAFDAAQVSKDFVLLYREWFGMDLPMFRPTLVSIRTTVFGRRRLVDLAKLAIHAEAGAPDTQAATTRRIRFVEGWRETPVARRESLRPGMSFDGPMLVEQLDTTTLIDPKCRVEVDAFANLVISVERNTQ